MSRARDRLRKEKKAKAMEASLADGAKTMDDFAYAASIKRQINKGLLPKYMLKKSEHGTKFRKLEYPITLVSTYNTLVTKK